MALYPPIYRKRQGPRPCLLFYLFILSTNCCITNVLLLRAVVTLSISSLCVVCIVNICFHIIIQHTIGNPRVPINDIICSNSILILNLLNFPFLYSIAIFFFIPRNSIMCFWVIFGTLSILFN